MGLRLLLLIAVAAVATGWGHKDVSPGDPPPLLLAVVVSAGPRDPKKGRKRPANPGSQSVAPSPPPSSAPRAVPEAQWLLREGFDSTNLDAWISYVGGENEPSPSWRVTQGALEQPHVDGLIRAFLVGDPSWENFAVEARLRIVSSEDDSRAGLVFRDDGRGFYVLRIAKGVARAQLMYHCRSPFGWHELATVPLVGVTIADAWVTLRVEARGPYLQCYVDGQQFIDLADSRSTHGLVGFYACEAHALFDDLTVAHREAIPLPASRRGSPPYAPSQSFWFRETFTDPIPESWDLPQGWTVGSAICYRPIDQEPMGLARLRGAPLADGALQIKIRLLDLPLEEILKQGAQAQPRASDGAPDPARGGGAGEAMGGSPAPVSGTPSAPPAPRAPSIPARKGRGGMVFRGNGSKYYALLLDRSGQTLTLVYRDDDTAWEETLGTATFKEVPEDRWYTLYVEVKGDQMLASIDGIPAIGIKDSRMASGYVGLFCDAGPTIFTDLWGASGR